MRLVDQVQVWSSRGMGGKATSGNLSSPTVPLAPSSAHPASSSSRLDPMRVQLTDYLYLVGLVAVVVLAAYILVFG